MTIKSHVAPRPWTYEYRPGKINHRFSVAMSGENVRFAIHAVNFHDSMFAFIKEIADAGCWENPGEFPETGESGQAPCLSCRAKAIIAKAENNP